MAQPIIHNRNIIWGIGAGIVILLALLFALGGGHNSGQPSAQSGPGNAMQTDQGR